MKNLSLHSKICMIVPEVKVCGGIAAMTGGYRGSRLEEDYDITYVESYCDGSKLQKLVKALKAYRSYIHLLNNEQIELVHIHSSFGPSFYRKLPFINIAYKRHIPVINHIHGAEFEDFFTNASARKKKLIVKTYLKCAKLIALSDEWQENLSQIVPKENISVIPNYSLLHPEALKTSAGQSNNSPVNILFLGELGHRKGVYDLIDIADRACRISKVKLHFILAGKGSDEDERAIKEKTISLGMTSEIEFPGWIRGDEKDKALKEADIFMLPSYNEGMPMSILDACGYGLPILASDVGGIPKIVIKGQNGFTASPGDIEAFAVWLARLAEDQVLRSEMGRASYELVEKEYSLDAHIDKLEALWEKTLKENDKGKE